jgi:dihydroxyacetone kinase
VLHIVKNYTGDRLNFAIAGERLRARGIRVEEVVVDDDIGSENEGVGRRGTAATVVVEKILGAAADQGASLQSLKELGLDVARASRTLAVARAAHTMPHTDKAAFPVLAGELEYGVGIHGETARERILDPGLSALIERMTNELLATIPEPSDGVIVLVNGLGGASQLELLHVLAETARALTARGVKVRSAVTGDFTTALDMAGFSLTLSAVQETWLPHWFAAHDTVALPRPRPWVETTVVHEAAPFEAREASEWLTSFVATVKSLRDAFNRLDQQAGDGDIGTNLANASEAALSRATGATATLADDLGSIADAFGDDTGGSSGPLFGIVFHALADAVSESGSLGSGLIGGLRAASEAVTRVGGAHSGDRTLVDALEPAARASETLDLAAAKAAVAGAAETRNMLGGRGRSSYLGDRVIGTPDPGAVAMAYFVVLLAEAATGDVFDDVRAELQAMLNV